MEPILSLRHFAHLVGTPIERLYEIADNVEAHYRVWQQQDKKNPAIYRTRREPLPELKALHRRIVKRVLEPLGHSACAHGGIKGCSPRSNAGIHLGRECVVTMDVRKFFEHTRHYVIYRLLRREYGFGRDVASLITRLCTYRAALPEGAPPSTALANLLLMRAVDQPLTAVALERGLENTRFVDDIALSGSDPRSMINMTGRLLSRVRLPMWRRRKKSKSKLKIMPRSVPQEITGLLVNAKAGPSLSKRKRDAVRWAIFKASKMSDSQQQAAAVRSIEGRIAHVAQYNPGSAKRLRAQLDNLTA